MSEKKTLKETLVLTVPVLLVVLSRLLPHPDNFTPVAALAIFSAAAFSRSWHGIIITFVAMFVSDIFIGFHDTLWIVYLSLGFNLVFGYMLKKKISFLRVAGFTLAGSLQFFITTNFVVWATSGMYAHTAAGLVQCYTMALPFLRNSVVSDLLFSGLLFGSAYMSLRQFRLFQSSHWQTA